ncbi:CRISPR-associated endonuclease/helicase Cas3 [Clostridium cavendishii DSM 21758]|uniref:CRISPR-associated endonuclease/helicase Cas3 n=1 Tax=Clostridium cavendishii DSM 21758 TaxID=1121302 RepID=A0A1M6VD83_9CLOT|nr:CRISPR-associated helicase/endonuclease Cas3 [Clostridium cavendishii]SHK79409.1 CRISPR-associated endonuclease/helicase Cas3 [Clostridium cavendishii DSM 21758]
MYFEDVELFKLEDNISELDSFFAHTKGGEREKLKDHMDLVYKYFLRIVKQKNLDKVFRNLHEQLLENQEMEVIEFWKELFCNAIYLHDIGKINIDFQYFRMKNKKFKDASQENPKHSMLSSILYFNYYIGKIRSIEGEAKKLLLVFLYINSYVISKHHGELNDFVQFLDSFGGNVDTYIENKNLYPNYKGKIIIKGSFIKKRNEDITTKLEEVSKKYNIELYIYTKLLSALLTSADFYATSDYDSNKEIKDFGLIDNSKEYYDIYKNSDIYKNIDKHRNFLDGRGSKIFEDNDINKLRSEMFIEAEDNLVKNTDKNIFYLEAPTGSGKTMTSINLAFKLLEQDKSKNKLFYIFPFNTLVEQTNISLLEVFANNEKLKDSISIINSVTPIKTVDENESNEKVKVEGVKEKIDYKKSLLNRQFIHYPIVLTTHVNFFNYLFGTSREESFPLLHLANSVVVLDEIQSYKNSIWKEIIYFLEKYSKLLNIKIIIMSATLPKLEELGCKDDNFVYLIENRDKYFNDPLFKNRVSLDFSMLDINEDIKDILFKKVIEESKSNKKIVVEFIKKQSAMDFYKELYSIKDSLNKEVLLITGDDNKIERRNIISKVKEKGSNIILVATQVIEAGVDIDMDIGFKDISILDAEEQFLGRVNRSCKKANCKVYFFDIDEVTRIYKNDLRKNKQFTLENDSIRSMLENKNFGAYYSGINALLEGVKKEENDNNFDAFLKEKVAKLKFKEVNNIMRLIDNEIREYTIFFDREVELEDGVMLRGNEVWDKYKILLQNNDLEYAEKKVRLSEINEKVDYFTYKVRRFEKSYNDSIGEIFYIEDSEQYFNEGKFDRKKFEEKDGFEYFDL